MSDETFTAMDGRATALVAQAQTGDEKAFAELLLPHEGRLERVVRSRLFAAIRRVGDTDDIVQEVRRKAWDALRSGKFQYQGDQPFGAWLSTIAGRCITDLVRRGHAPSQWATVGDEEKLLDVSEDAKSPGSLLAHRERTQGVRDVLELMPEDLRCVVELRMQGLAFADIAEQIGVTEGAARMRDLRGKQFVRTSSDARALCRDWSSISLPTSD